MKRLKYALIGVSVLLCAALLVRGSLPQITSGSWAPAGSMSQVRDGAAAVLLPDGRVLITGGANGTVAANTADLFGAGGGFSAAPTMSSARARHTATVLADGRVLVA